MASGWLAFALLAAFGLGCVLGAWIGFHVGSGTWLGLSGR